MATTVLGFTESFFWRMTLKKFIYLWKQHQEYNAPRERGPAVQVQEQNIIGENERASIDALDFL